MKKVLLVSALVLVIATSMVSGTLADYHVTLPTITDSVMAKNFVLTGMDTTVGDKLDVHIAPGETQTFTFTVSNFDSSGVAEVSMDLSIDIGLAKSTSTNVNGAIVPLVVTCVNDADSTALLHKSGEINPTLGTGTLKYSDTLTNIGTKGQTNTYTVTITWPSTASDTNYAGHSFGSALTVLVTGTQQ